MAYKACIYKKSIKNLPDKGIRRTIDELLLSLVKGRAFLLALSYNILAAKNSPDGLYRAAILSSNIRRRLLYSILIGGSFLNYL